MLPFTVSVNPGLPAEMLLGEILAITGTGADKTVRLSEFEIPPPGAGFPTVITRDPTTVMSLARIWAIN